jgi:hypothetical protein
VVTRVEREGARRCLDVHGGLDSRGMAGENRENGLEEGEMNRARSIGAAALVVALGAALPANRR